MVWRIIMQSKDAKAEVDNNLWDLHNSSYQSLIQSFNYSFKILSVLEMRQSKKKHTLLNGLLLFSTLLTFTAHKPKQSWS